MERTVIIPFEAVILLRTQGMTWFLDRAYTIRADKEWDTHLRLNVLSPGSRLSKSVTVDGLRPKWFTIILTEANGYFDRNLCKSFRGSQWVCPAWFCPRWMYCLPWSDALIAWPSEVTQRKSKGCSRVLVAWEIWSRRAAPDHPSVCLKVMTIGPLKKYACFHRESGLLETCEQ